MRKVMAGMLGALLLACGGAGGGLPTGETPKGDGSQPLPPPETPPAAKSLWPLTTGSHWTYRISDPQRGQFDKTVEVLGVMDVPGTSAKAVAVKSTQPYLEELSWQLVANGVVVRVREEDSKDGALARVTTWDPTTMKSLDAEQPVGWSHDETVTETVTDGAGNVTDQKEKTFSWTVTATGESVQAGGRTYEGAIKLQRARPDKSGWERTYWLVPGIGKVREEGERTEELVDYSIAP